MKKPLLILFFFIFLLNYSYAEEIIKCTNLTNLKNKIFEIKRNILNKGSVCFYLTNSNNVTFICKNTNIVGLNFNKGFIIKNSSNINLINCTFRNLQIGVYLENVKNSTFKNLQFIKVKTPFYLKNTENNKFEGYYKKEQFKFEGTNNNDYPFFELSSFLKKYKISIFLIIFANIALLLDFIYERKLKKFVEENYFQGLMLSLFFAYVAFFIIENEKIKSIFYFISLISIFFPYLVEKFKEYLFIKEIEEEFSVFVLDLSQLVKSGMPLTKAIIVLSKNDYGLLTDLINKLAIRLSWGLNFKESLELFAEESKSNLIKKIVKGLIETRESGGNIISYLESLIGNLSVLNHLKKERESIMYRKIMQFYLMYFFLILTIVGLNKFVLPFVQEATKKGIEMTAVGSIKPTNIMQPKKVYNFDSIFFFLALVQSFFSGLIIGKMTAGTFKAGIKHLAILFPITYIIMKLAGF